jgi:membrane-bound lytic murein transglycosylase C
MSRITTSATHRSKILRSAACNVMTLLAAAALSAGCATSALVGKNVQRVMAGQGIDGSGFDAAVKDDRKALDLQLQQLHEKFTVALASLKGNVQKRWGTNEVKVSDRTTYVKYTQGYKARVVTDFDHGVLRVETLDEKNPRGSLEAAIVSALLTSSDPSAVDLFTDKDVTLDANRKPYLYGLVQDQHGKPIRTREQAEKFAKFLLAHKVQTRIMTAESGAETSHFVELAMVRNFESQGADRYRPLAVKYGTQYHVRPSLVLAIMKTESHFNPFAVSGAPAYGLMQLVPTSGGRAAYKRAKGLDETPTPDYLFDADHNVELGAAYLGELADNEYRGVGNAESRDYCVIAAYNTGPGNVAKAFSDKQVIKAINSLPPSALYERLHTRLPYEETKNYLVRVTDNRREFLGEDLAPVTAMR